MNLCWLVLLVLYSVCGCSPVLCSPRTISSDDLIQAHSYFPVGSFSASLHRDRKIARSYTRALREIGEPSLNTTTDAFRLSYYPSINGHRMVVRLWKERGSPRLRAVRFSDFDCGSETKWSIVEAKLTQERWSQLTAAVEEAHFWALPAEDHRLGLDGDDYVLEGASSARFHVVKRWSPEQGDSFLELCRLILSWARANVELRGLAANEGPPSDFRFGHDTRPPPRIVQSSF